jgi:hypothetical protein
MNFTNLQELAVAYALGAIEQREAALLEQIAAGNPSVQAELAALLETAAALAASTEIDPAQKYRPGVLGALRRGVVAWIAHVYLRVAGSTGRY